MLCIFFSIHPASANILQTIDYVLCFQHIFHGLCSVICHHHFPCPILCFLCVRGLYGPILSVVPLISLHRTKEIWHKRPATWNSKLCCSYIRTNRAVSFACFFSPFLQTSLAVQSFSLLNSKISRISDIHVSSTEFYLNYL